MRGWSKRGQEEGNITNSTKQEGGNRRNGGRKRNETKIEITNRVKKGREVTKG